jgi:hypothetical protein
MQTTSSTGFSDRVQAVIAGLNTQGLIDRFAANDVLLDLLDAAATDDESGRVLDALGSLPKSSLVDRSMLAGLLAGLCSQN